MSASPISGVRYWWRRARRRSAVLVACSGSAMFPAGRSRAQVSIRAAVVRTRSCSRSSAGAVTSRALTWLVVWLRALTALLRATRSVRIASIRPSRALGAPVAAPASAARAAE